MSVSLHVDHLPGHVAISVTGPEGLYSAYNFQDLYVGLQVYLAVLDCSERRQAGTGGFFYNCIPHLMLV